MTTPQEQYAAGKKFRVVKEGARLSGMEPKPGYLQGWGQVLHIGDVIECAGLRGGWGSDPGPDTIQWRVEGKSFVEFLPREGGMWGPHAPAEGYLEEVS